MSAPSGHEDVEVLLPAQKLKFARLRLPIRNSQTSARSSAQYGFSLSTRVTTHVTRYTHTRQTHSHTLQTHTRPSRAHTSRCTHTHKRTSRCTHAYTLVVLYTHGLRPCLTPYHTVFRKLLRGFATSGLRPINGPHPRRLPAHRRALETPHLTK